MAIKNTALGGTDWGAEGVDYEDLNDTFDAVNLRTFRRITSDSTPASTTNTSYVTLATLSIGAGVVKDHIEIKATYKGNWQYLPSSNNGSYANANILIGEAGSEVSKYCQIIARKAGAVQCSGAVLSDLNFYYEPTTDEKTNGFNIILQGSTPQEGGTPSGAGCAYIKCDIFGV